MSTLGNLHPRATHESAAEIATPATRFPAQCGLLLVKLSSVIVEFIAVQQVALHTPPGAPNCNLCPAPVHWPGLGDSWCQKLSLLSKKHLLTWAFTKHKEEQNKFNMSETWKASSYKWVGHQTNLKQKLVTTKIWGYQESSNVIFDKSHMVLSSLFPCSL